MGIDRYIKPYPSQVEEYSEIELGKLNRPYVAYLEDEDRIDGDSYVELPYDYTQDCFTVIVNQSGYLELNKNGSPPNFSLKYSLDEGETWSTFPTDTRRVQITTDGEQRIQLKGTNKNGFSSSSSAYYYFRYWTTESGSRKYLPFTLEGNLLSLIDETNYKTLTTLAGQSIEGTFRYLFSGSTVVDASNLAMPATILKGYDYQSMFHGCSSLISAPKELPTISAEGNAAHCFEKMFYNCTSLVNPPKQIELLGTNIPFALQSMFQYCTSLKKSPIMKIDLSTGSEHQKSYFCNMLFSECNSLEEVICLSPAPPDSANHYTELWMRDVASQGTLYHEPGVDWSSVTRANWSVPTGWNLVPYEEE